MPARITLQRSPIAPWNHSCSGGLSDPTFQPSGSGLKGGKLHWGLPGCLGEGIFGFHPALQNFQARINLDFNLRFSNFRNRKSVFLGERGKKS